MFRNTSREADKGRKPGDSGFAGSVTAALGRDRAEVRECRGGAGSLVTALHAKGDILSNSPEDKRSQVKGIILPQKLFYCHLEQQQGWALTHSST